MNKPGNNVVPIQPVAEEENPNRLPFSLEEMLAEFDNGQVPRSTYWRAMIRALYETANHVITGVRSVADVKPDNDGNISLSPYDINVQDINTDIFGRQLFYGDACKVINKSNNNYEVLPGSAYVGGIRFTYSGKQDILIEDNISTGVWIDISWIDYLQSEEKANADIVVSDEVLSDYVDDNGVFHCLEKIASINAGEVITDLRITNGGDFSSVTHVNTDQAKIDNNINREFIRPGDKGLIDYKKNNVLSVGGFIDNAGNIWNPANIGSIKKLYVDNNVTTLNISEGGNYDIYGSIEPRDTFIEIALQINITGNDVVRVNLINFVSDLNFQAARAVFINSSNDNANIRVENMNATRVKKTLIDQPSAANLFIEGRASSVILEGLNLSESVIGMRAGKPGISGASGVTVNIVRSKTVYPPTVRINDISVSNVYSDDISYYDDQDGISVLSGDYPTFNTASSLIVSNYRGKNCLGRILKSQVRLNDICGIVYDQDMFGSSSTRVAGIDLQYSGGEIRNVLAKIGDGYAYNDFIRCTVRDEQATSTSIKNVEVYCPIGAINSGVTVGESGDKTPSGVEVKQCYFENCTDFVKFSSANKDKSALVKCINVNGTISHSFVVIQNESTPKIEVSGCHNYGDDKPIYRKIGSAPIQTNILALDNIGATRDYNPVGVMTGYDEIQVQGTNLITGKILAGTVSEYTGFSFNIRSLLLFSTDRGRDFNAILNCDSSLVESIFSGKRITVRTKNDLDVADNINIWVEDKKLMVKNNYTDAYLSIFCVSGRVL